MTANVAVARWFEVLARGFELKHLKVGAELAAVEAVLLEHAAWIDVEVFVKPVVIANPGAEFVDELAPDDVDKELVSLLNGRHGKAEVFCPTKAGDSRCRHYFFITHVSIIEQKTSKRKHIRRKLLQMDTFGNTVNGRNFVCYIRS
jgi:hypothetical protein